MVQLPAQIGVEVGFPHVGPPAGVDPVEDVPAPDELHHHVRVELRHLRRPHRRPGRAPVQLLVIGARVPDRPAQRDATAHPAGVVQRDAVLRGRVADGSAQRQRQAVAHEEDAHRTVPAANSRRRRGRRWGIPANLPGGLVVADDGDGLEATGERPPAMITATTAATTAGMAICGRGNRNRPERIGSATRW